MKTWKYPMIALALLFIAMLACVDVEPTAEPSEPGVTSVPTATVASTATIAPTATTAPEIDVDQYLIEASELVTFSAENSEALAEVMGMATNTPSVVLRADWQQAVWNGAQNKMDVHSAWKAISDVPEALQPAHDMVELSFSYGWDAGFALQTSVRSIRDGDMDSGLEWLAAAVEELNKEAVTMILANELLDKE